MRNRGSRPIDSAQIVTEHAQRLLRNKVRALIVEKLTKLKVSPPGYVTNEIVGMLFSGETSTVHWDDARAEGRTADIVITDDDVQDLEATIVKLTESLPEAIEKASIDVSRALLRKLVRRWPTEQDWQLAETLGFQERLEERWGEPLGLLRMLLTIVRELGAEHAKKLRRSRSKKPAYLSQLILRLHVRACRVTAEIISLLECGFADGAMGRWRTLHEISVIATVIYDGGEALAERYVYHQAIESKAALAARRTERPARHRSPVQPPARHYDRAAATGALVQDSPAATGGDLRFVPDRQHAGRERLKSPHRDAGKPDKK